VETAGQSSGWSRAACLFLILLHLTWPELRCRFMFADVSGQGGMSKQPTRPDLFSARVHRLLCAARGLKSPIIARAGAVRLSPTVNLRFDICPLCRNSNVVV
jgi:hypothetical protein